MATSGRPLIFWEQQALENQKKSKKFTYKKRDQKFPLRSKGRPGEQEPPDPIKTTHTHPQDDYHSLRRATNGHEPKRIAEKSAGQKPAGKRTDWQALGRRGKGQIGNGTVTLTQAQLDAILETVGRLALDKDKLAATAGASKEDKATSVSKPPSSINPRGKPDTTLSGGNKPNGGSSAEMNKTFPMAETAGKEKSRHQSSPNVAHTEVADTPQKAATKPLSKSTDFSDLKLSVVSPEATVQPAYATPVPLTHLTKAERKRIQWERERAEEARIVEFNPWGRPGGGAPIRDRQGNMLNDYNTRKSGSGPVLPPVTQQSEDLILQEKLQKVKVQNVDQSSHATEQTQSTQPSQSAQPAQSTQPAKLIQSVQPPPINGLNSITGPQGEPAITDILPPAIRSNFVIGDSAPDSNMYATANELKRREWLQELEKQREEQQQRRLLEKQRWKHLESGDNWAERFTTPHSKPPPAQQASPQATVDDAAAGVASPPGLIDVDTSRSFSAPAVELDGGAEPLGSTFLRGQNMMVDPVTRHEMEEKRRRHLEHQEFIRMQVEEKERAKRAERDRKRREELEEEEKLERERDEIQRQFNMEQQKRHNKEETQRRKVEVLKEAMSKAQEDAEREKHERRLQRLHQGGHDTSRLHANYEEPGLLTHHVSTVNDLPSDQNKDRAIGQRGDVSAVASLTAVGAPPRRDAGSRTQASVPLEAYIENRVLTPSAYRTAHGNPLSPGREFGTQTDTQNYIIDQRMNREATEIEYRATTNTGVQSHGRTKSNPKKTVRVVSNVDARNRTNTRQVVEQRPPEEGARRNKPIKISERPRWGAAKPQPLKRPAKQSERDPFYEQKRRTAEMRTAERQKEMLALAAANLKHVAAETTASSRARSRNDKDKSPGGAGRGKSRSKSPPDGHASRVESHVRRNRSRTPPRTDARLNRCRSISPPVPAIKHRLGSNQSATELNGHHETSDHRHRTVYRDSSPVAPPVHNGEFVPFIRSMDVLDPAHADSPIQLSRENSAAERARISYLQEHAPGTYGVHMQNYDDKRLKPPVKDPIMNHSMVTDHPTGRQDRILQQLSDLRRGLMMKQRELEMGLAVAPSDNSHGVDDSGY